MSLPTPNTRKEQYLNAIATGNTVDMPAKPITREEEYLDAIAKNGGGGSGEGDMKKSVYDSDLAVANAGGISAFVDDAVSGKVDKVAGKGLSENDYSDTEKGKVAANAEAIEATQNMISDAYDPTATYAVGDYCIYNDTLYKCNTAIATGEAFTPAKWNSTNVSEELGELTERMNVAYKNEWHGFTFLSQLISKNLMLVLASGTASENISAWSYFTVGYTVASSFYSSDNRFYFEGNKLKVNTNISQGDSLSAIMVCDI